MFNTLTDKLSNVFDNLRGRGFLTEENITDALREVRVALLEADVALPVAKDFIARVKEKAVGEAVIKSISPAQMVIKIVSDELTAMLGGAAEGEAPESPELNLRATPPVVVLMAGLQGSGKTTSCGKIALRLKDKQKKKILMASLDVYRPAAQQQLATLGQQAKIDTLPIIEGETPVQITKRALKQAKLEAYDVLFLDTAGRLHIDADMMAELKDVHTLAKPTETLLVVDSLTGQDAVVVAKQFAEHVTITGVVMTRVDGDARGGAALSMRAVTGCPIRYVGVGEKLHELEPFHAERIAQRILGMGDVVSLVEKAAETVDKAEAEKMAKKMAKGEFDLNDLYKQLEQIKKMGGIGGLMGMMPGINKYKDKLEEAGMNEKMVGRQQAIITSMTKQERRFPKLLNASRKLRVAKGSGVTVQDVNMLLKQFTQMQTMMKKFSKGGMGGLMKQMMGGKQAALMQMMEKRKQ